MSDCCAFPPPCEYTNVQMFFLTFSLLGTSAVLLFSFLGWMTGSSTRKTYDSEDELTDVWSDSEDEEIPYTSQYPLKDATDSKHVRGRLERYFLIESTPNGVIVMMYDPDRESFVYWGDSASIPYNVLETVARKFVTTYGCGSIYVERCLPTPTQKKEETKSAEEPEGVENPPDHKSSEGEPENSDDDVFVKKVTRATAKNGPPAALRANSYLRLGKVHDFKPIEDKNEKNVDFKAFIANHPLTSSP